jgi:hypothetical protein
MKKKKTSGARTSARPRTKSNGKRHTRLSTRHGALDIEHGLGALRTSRAIAKSLKKAADASEMLTTAPFNAAMAAIDHLIEFLDRQKERLEGAKIELCKLYGEVLEDAPGGWGSPADEYRRARSRRRPKRRPRIKTSSIRDLPEILPT